MPLTLDSFRQIAGSGISTGFVGSETDNGGNLTLTKLGAHRHFTSLNAEEIKRANNDENGYIRSSLYAHLGMSLVNAADRTKADAVLAYARKALGIEIKPSDKPLERRVVRELIALRDEAVGAGGASKMNRKDAAIANFLKNPTREGCTFSGKEALNLLVGLKAMRANGAASYEVNINGRTAYLTKVGDGDIRLRTATGTSKLEDFNPMKGDQQLFRVLEEKVFTQDLPSPMTRDFARSAVQVVSSPTLAMDTHSAEAMRARELCAAVVLGFGEGKVSTHDLTTLTAFTMKTLVESIADGRIPNADKLKEAVVANQTPDLLNADEAQALAEQYQKASAEDKARVEQMGENPPPPRPAPSSVSFGGGFLGFVVSGFKAAKSAISNLSDKLGHKNETDNAKLQKNIQNMLADIVSEEDTVEVDQRHGQPGARLAYTLDKHVDTLVTVLTEPERAEKAVPEESKDIFDMLVSTIKDNLGDSVSALMNKPTALKASIKLALSSPDVHNKLAAAEARIDDQVMDMVLDLQNQVGDMLKEVISGKGGAKKEDKAGEAKKETDPKAAKPEAGAEAAKPEAGAEVVKPEVAKTDAEPEVAEQKGEVEGEAKPKTEPKAAEQKGAVEGEAKPKTEPKVAKPEAGAAEQKGAVEGGKPKAGQYRNLVEMIREEAPGDKAMQKALAKLEELPPAKPEEQTLGSGDNKVVVPVKPEDIALWKDKTRAYNKKMAENRLAASRELLNKLGSDSATDFTRGYGKFMVDVITQYFIAMPMQDIRTMIASGIRMAKPDASKGERMGALLKGAGPIMHKMLQGLASGSNVSDDFKEALEDMRSHLRPIPQEIIKANLLDMVKRSNGKIEAITVEKSLGEASVGQALLCSFKMAGSDEPRKVVVKLLRPDVETRVERERELFEAVAKTVPGMEVTFAGQLASILDELDLRKEAANTEMGKVYDPGVADVKSMKLLDVVEPTKYSFAVEVAPGKSVDRLLKDVDAKLAAINTHIQDMSDAPLEEKVAAAKEAAKKAGTDKFEMPEKKKFTFKDLDSNVAHYTKDVQDLAKMYNELHVQQKRLVTLVQKWATEGIFKSGFYHGDLHAGNIMVDDKFQYDDQGKLKLEGNGGLTVIDFGNATQLEEAQKKYIIRMMAAATVKDTNSFLDAFRELMTPGGRVSFDKQRVEIHDLVHEIFSLGTGENAADRIFAVLQKLMQRGHELPSPIFKFSQCTVRLQGTLDQVTNAMDKIQDTITRARLAASGHTFGIEGMSADMDLTYGIFTDIVTASKESSVGRELEENKDLFAANWISGKIATAKGNLNAFVELDQKGAAHGTEKEQKAWRNAQESLVGYQLTTLLDSMFRGGAKDVDYLKVLVDELGRHGEEVAGAPDDAEQAKGDAAAIKEAQAKISQLLDTNKTREAYQKYLKVMEEKFGEAGVLSGKKDELRRKQDEIRGLRAKANDYKTVKAFLQSPTLSNAIKGGEDDRAEVLKDLELLLQIFSDETKLPDDQLVAFMTEVAEVRGATEDQKETIFGLDNPAKCRANVANVLSELALQVDDLRKMTDQDAEALQREYERRSTDEGNNIKAEMASIDDQLEKSENERRKVQADFEQTQFEPLKDIIKSIAPAFTRQNIRIATKLRDDVRAAQASLQEGVNMSKDSFSDAIGSVILQNLSKSAKSLNPLLGLKVMFQMNEEQIPV